MWITRELSVPAAEAWAVLVNVGTWPQWGPTVAAVRLDPPGPVGRIGAGRTGHVRAVVGPWVPFAITDFADGQHWSWRVAGIPATSHRVEVLGPRRCRVGFRVPLVAAPYALVCAVALRRIAGLTGG